MTLPSTHLKAASGPLNASAAGPIVADGPARHALQHFAPARAEGRR
jgi:hypothetical protein